MDTVSDSLTLPFPLRRFSVDEYHRMGEAGILTEDDAVELLEGLVIPKMNRSPQHDMVIGLVDQALRPRLPKGWILRLQNAITTTTSEPEPDVAVVRGEVRDFGARHPTGAEIGLIVEVAETSLARDRAKARIYATAGVPFYWIVNLDDESIEAYSQPNASQSMFTKQATCRRGDQIPFALAGAKLAIPADELLP